MSKIITPLLAVDIIIELIDHQPFSIVLIERKNVPFGWALPGGFVDVGETCEHAAIREALEETCLNVTLKSVLGVYSDPQRDPRGHTVSIVYVASAHGVPQAADDAKTVKTFNPTAIDVHLVFDHKLIMSDYQNYLITQQGAPLRSF